MTHPARPVEREGPPAGSAILRAFKVLDVISDVPEGLGLAEICLRVGLPKPTVFRILCTLEHEGLIVRQPGQRRYQAGDRLSRFATAVLMGSPHRSARRAILDELVEQIGETCNLTVPNGYEVLYIDRVETGRPITTGVRQGSGAPLYAAASGKLFLSELSERARERFSRQVPRVAWTSQTLIERAALDQELRRIRMQGYATECGEYLPGRCCIAVPVRGLAGRIVAALSVEAATERTPLADLIEFVPQIRIAANAIAETFDA